MTELSDVAEEWNCPLVKNYGQGTCTIFFVDFFPRGPFLKPLVNSLQYHFYFFTFLVYCAKGKWDLSFLTRHWTHTPCIRRRISTTRLPGKSICFYWKDTLKSNSLGEENHTYSPTALAQPFHFHISSLPYAAISLKAICSNNIFSFTQYHPQFCFCSSCVVPSGTQYVGSFQNTFLELSQYSIQAHFPIFPCLSLCHSGLSSKCCLFRKTSVDSPVLYPVAVTLYYLIFFTVLFQYKIHFSIYVFACVFSPQPILEENYVLCIYGHFKYLK